MVVKSAQQMTTDAGTAAQASAFAYYRTILPFIKAASASDAAAISNAINISGAPQANAYATIQDAFASGNFRLKSVSCPSFYITISLDCNRNSVNLRKSSDATGTRSIWKLNQASGAFGGINSARTYPENVLSATSVPSLAKSGKFKVSPFTAGNGKTVTLAAEKATSKGAFLAVNKACTGLGWSTSGASSQAKFTVSSA
ncbi:hypothetical protein Ndes2526B_g00604 [Nannochloris sp. 'desiccata']|nr:hypothetical protein NADE_003761 [Chlorella desiccata (nom. nud.)]